MRRPRLCCRMRTFVKFFTSRRETLLARHRRVASTLCKAGCLFNTLSDVSVNRCRVVGHRGAPRAAPENTLASLEAAGRMGADGVEVDLRVCGDGSIAVIHDAELGRTTAGHGPVRGADADTLRALGVPLLEDVVDLCRRLGLWLDLEVKEEEPAIAAALASVSLDHGGIVSSFLPGALDLVAEHAPHLGRALLAIPGVDAEASMEAAIRHGAWNPPLPTVVADPSSIGRARERGLSVHVWTVNEPDDMRLLAAAGADSVITDVPDVARAALA